MHSRTSSSTVALVRRSVPLVLVVTGILLGVASCSETASPPVTAEAPALLLSTGECGVSFTVVTTMTDSAALNYGAPSQTDTAHVCETWTGSDYQIQVTQTGSSEPVSEYSEDVKTVVYANGFTTPYAADNGAMEAGSAVGATAFEFGQATSAEQQASYNDPYYGVAQDTVVADCPQDPKADVCGASAGSTSSGPSAASASTADIPIPREHGLRRKALRALLSDKDEISPSVEGYRRFRSVVGDEETIVGVDPITELMRTQEASNPHGYVKARLFWRIENSRYIRHRMEIDSHKLINGKQVASTAVVSLSNVRFADGGR